MQKLKVIGVYFIVVLTFGITVPLFDKLGAVIGGGVGAITGYILGEKD